MSFTVVDLTLHTKVINLEMEIELTQAKNDLNIANEKFLIASNNNGL